MRMVHTTWAETAIEAMRATKGRREVTFMMRVLSKSLHWLILRYWVRDKSSSFIGLTFRMTKISASVPDPGRTG
jgi:hypothetical protein